MIELRLLGGIELSGVPTRSANELLGKPQPTALLAYLAVCSPAGFQRRDYLATLFWPETAQRYARANLRKLLLVLRSFLDKSIFETRGDEEVRIDPRVLWCDAVAYIDAVNNGQLERAHELFRGQLMPGFILGGSPAYQDWLDSIRRQYNRDAMKMVLGLADEHLRNGEHTAVGRLAQFICSIDSELQDERDLRKLIVLLDRIGDRSGALELYKNFRQRLDREFQSAPSKETRALIDKIRRE